jgi:SnoaL-like polyketide cyclase
LGTQCVGGGLDLGLVVGRVIARPAGRVGPLSPRLVCDGVVPIVHARELRQVALESEPPAAVGIAANYNPLDPQVVSILRSRRTRRPWTGSAFSIVFQSRRTVWSAARAPTDKRVKWTQISIVRFSDGRIVEGWAVADELSILQQLGQFTG